MNLEILLGRLHPLVVHFPIALILLAAATEAVRIKWDRPVLAQFSALLLVTGALGAVAASATGWMFAGEYYPPPSERWLLTWHKRSGIATTILACLSAIIIIRLDRTAQGRSQWPWRISVWLTAAVLIFTAHMGALMVWGADYFEVGSP